VIAPSGAQYELSVGEQRAVVVEVGGGLRSYSAGGRDVVDGYPLDELCRSGRGQVLAPWPNRLEDGAYEFDGRSFQVALSEPSTWTAIHGLVRWSSWRAVERAADGVTVEDLLYPTPGYPFLLRLRVAYRLDAGGLTVRTTATNEGHEACPFGLGHHPYLTRGTPTVDALSFRLPARTRLHVDERGLPAGREPVDGTPFDFREPRPIGALELNTSFTDLERDADGLARVRFDDLTLWLDAAYPYLQVFTGDPAPDVNRRSLAVEPMTCPPNAFRTGEGLIRLEPGETVSAAWGIDAP
jgi:aldose 1-epimerase